MYTLQLNLCSTILIMQAPPKKFVDNAYHATVNYIVCAVFMLSNAVFVYFSYAALLVMPDLPKYIPINNQTIGQPSHYHPSMNFIFNYSRAQVS